MSLVAVSVLLALVPQSSDAEAAASVMQRVFPEVASRFRFVEDPRPGKPRYGVTVENGTVTVKGSSAVAMCRGAYDYLREVGAAQATWSGTTLNVPNPLPNSTLSKECPYQWVLQDNVCVFGYTTAFYGWKEWERYLDVMALHGINMQFAPVGGEAIWERVWKSIGSSQKELDDFFTGPAFLPWHRMGNVNKHDGPLPQSYQSGSVKLQHQILKRMRELDIEPVAPGFAGFVPPGFKEKHPRENVLHVASWAGFGDDYRTWILHPLSPMYSEIGGRYIREWKKEFGEARYFLADSFNELEVPVSSDRAKRLEEVALFGKAVYDGIRAGDPDGVWVMQGWLFYNAAHFWDKETVAALLSRVPNDKMMILDLFAEAAPLWKTHNAFHGKQWMVSNITTWGGNNQAYGNFEMYSRLSADTLAAPDRGNLVGFGISFEGSESNEAQFVLLCDSAWQREPVAIPEFLRRVCLEDRYGKKSVAAEEAWRLFERSIYRMGHSIHPNHLVQSRPHDLGPASRGAVNDSPEFREGVRKLLQAGAELSGNELYRNDVLQLTAQWALLEADRMLRDAVLAQWFGEERVSKERRALFQELATAADRLLASHPLDRLNRWVELARAWGQTPEERNYYEADSKRQVTVWGGPVLSEYAAKMWAGLISNYYVPRWTLWLEAKRAGMEWDLHAWEEKWITTPGGFRSRPFDDPIVAAASLAERLRLLPESNVTADLFGPQVGAWSSGEQGRTYRVREWDVTGAVTGDGELIVLFQYTRGAHRLDIDGLELLADGQVIATDKHFGRTGTENVGNIFRFAVRGHISGKKYTLRAKVRSDGGSDSSGVIHARLKKQG